MDGNSWGSHLTVYLPSVRLVQTEIDSVYKALHRCGIQRQAGQGFAPLFPLFPQPSPSGGTITLQHHSPPQWCWAHLTIHAPPLRSKQSRTLPSHLEHTKHTNSPVKKWMKCQNGHFIKKTYRWSTNITSHWSE